MYDSQYVVVLSSHVVVEIQQNPSLQYQNKESNNDRNVGTMIVSNGNFHQYNVQLNNNDVTTMTKMVKTLYPFSGYFLFSHGDILDVH